MMATAGFACLQQPTTGNESVVWHVRLERIISLLKAYLEVSARAYTRDAHRDIIGVSVTGGDEKQIRFVHVKLIREIRARERDTRAQACTSW